MIRFINFSWILVCCLSTIGFHASAQCNAGIQFVAAGCPTYTLTDNSEIPIGETITSTKWYYNSQVDSALNTQVTLVDGDTVMVCHSITTTSGCWSFFCTRIYVDCTNNPNDSGPDCVAAFGYDGTACPTFTFTDSSTFALGDAIDPVSHYHFGQVEDTATNTTYTFPDNGTFLVCRSLYTVNGCWSNQCIEIDINCIVFPPCDSVESLWTSHIAQTSARLNWNATSGAYSYEIRGRALGNTNWVYLQIANGAPTFKNVNGLNDNTTYEWQIRAYCDTLEYNESAWSVVGQFTTGCQVPTNHTANPVVTNAARLNWDPVSGAIGYQIQGRRVGTTNWSTITVGGLTTSKDVYGLQPGNSYEWQVSTWCDVGIGNQSAYSGLDTFSTPLANRISAHSLHETKLKKPSLMVYPNPVYNFCKVTVKNCPEGPFSYEITNIRGEMMAVENGIEKEDFEIDASTLPSGLYFITFTGSLNEQIKFMVE